MKEFKLAVIAGDGIGPEVLVEGLKVLDKVAAKYSLSFIKTHYPLGAAHWHSTGEVLSDETMADIAKNDVILLGAVGDPTVPSGVLERGLLLTLRFAFDQYVNLRPAILRAGVTSPLSTHTVCSTKALAARKCASICVSKRSSDGWLIPI